MSHRHSSNHPHHRHHGRQRDHSHGSHRDDFSLLDHPNRSVFDWGQLLDLASLEKKNDLPAGIMTSLMRQESFGRGHAGSSAGASGLFQIMPSVARAYGIDAMNPTAAAHVAAAELKMHLNRYDGDVAKALASYNWGTGNTHRAITKYGKHWLDHAPDETQHYVANISRDIASDAVALKIQDRLVDPSAEKLDTALLDNHAITRHVQERLKALGYAVGKIDGDAGKKTRAAINAFEEVMADHGVRSATEVFHHDGLLDFASLEMMSSRERAISKRLENPDPTPDDPTPPAHRHGAHHRHGHRHR